MKYKITLAVDPGFGGTGICMFVDKDLYRFKNIKTYSESVYRYTDIARKVVSTYINWINDFRAILCVDEQAVVSDIFIVVEYPHVFNGIKGRAALMRGDIFSVATLIGSITTLAQVYLTSLMEDQGWQMCRISVTHAEVRKWKGQLSKKNTMMRVLRDVKYANHLWKDMTHDLRLSDKYPDHIFDAVGLGMWFVRKNGEAYENK